MTITITKATIGGSENTWGATTNQALDDLVDVLNGNTASTPDLTAGSWKVGGAAVTSSAAELNKLDGFTGDASDLNYAKDLRATGVTATEFDKLDGLTATTAELNYTDGVTSNIQTQLNGKLGGSNASATITTLNSTTVNATTVDLGNWTISQSGSSLKFFYNGTARFALSSSGALTVENDVTAFGSA
jgi:hypothetical protein